MAASTLTPARPASQEPLDIAENSNMTPANSPHFVPRDNP
jgi:hypothetical protein